MEQYSPKRLRFVREAIRLRLENLYKDRWLGSENDRCGIYDE